MKLTIADEHSCAWICKFQYWQLSSHIKVIVFTCDNDYIWRFMLLDSLCVFLISFNSMCFHSRFYWSDIILNLIPCICLLNLQILILVIMWSIIVHDDLESILWDSHGCEVWAVFERLGLLFFFLRRHSMYIGRGLLYFWLANAMQRAVNSL